MKRLLRPLLLAGLLCAATSIVLGIWVAPAIEATRPAASGWLRWLYSPLCHQLAARSLEWLGQPLAVCARCSALYGGALIGLLVGTVLALRAWRPRPVWLLYAALPTAVDALLPWIGLPALSNVPRGWVALPAGLAAGLFLAVGLVEIVFNAPLIVTGKSRSIPASLEVMDG